LFSHQEANILPKMNPEVVVKTKPGVRKPEANKTSTTKYHHPSSVPIALLLPIGPIHRQASRSLPHFSQPASKEAQAG
jgi:hypothetical protein